MMTSTFHNDQHGQRGRSTTTALHSSARFTRWLRACIARYRCGIVVRAVKVYGAPAQSEAV
jgi:hypothetical protein